MFQFLTCCSGLCFSVTEIAFFKRAKKVFAGTHISLFLQLVREGLTARPHAPFVPLNFVNIKLFVLCRV